MKTKMFVTLKEVPDRIKSEIPLISHTTLSIHNLMFKKNFLYLYRIRNAMLLLLNISISYGEGIVFFFQIKTHWRQA